MAQTSREERGSITGSYGKSVDLVSSIAACYNAPERFRFELSNLEFVY